MYVIICGDVIVYAYGFCAHIFQCMLELCARVSNGNKNLP